MVTMERDTPESVGRELGELGVTLLSHREARGRSNVVAWAKIFGWKNAPMSIWMTQYPYIYHPITVTDPYDHWQVLAHEVVHCWQQKAAWSTWGWCIWYGMSQQACWEAERVAYLRDIINERRTVQGSVSLLRTMYRLRKPAEEMTAWFEHELEGQA